MIPAILFFNPEFADPARVAAAGGDWSVTSGAIWAELVRPIAVGAMIAGAIWTLFRMRRSLGEGLRRSFHEAREGATAGAASDESDRDVPFSWTAAGIAALVVPTFLLYNHYTGQPLGALGSAIVMIVAGFFFSAVAGYLVGIVGSSSNPVSGLTISTLLLAALLMTFLGVTGMQGVTAVLAVAAVVCCACAVAGDMLQDLKVGRLLGGTPFRMEWAEIIGVVFASFFLVLPMILLHEGDVAAGGIGVGGAELPAPQAGLMALLSQGIVGGDMRWPLVAFGIALCVFLILIQAPSPMLIAVGMYLPLQTTFAIFAGGFIRWIADRRMAGLSAGRRQAGESAGTLIASGLIAGEALMGVGLSGFAVWDFALPSPVAAPSGVPGFLVFLVLGWFLVRLPLRAAAAADAVGDAKARVVLADVRKDLVEDARPALPLGLAAAVTIVLDDSLLEDHGAPPRVPGHAACVRRTPCFREGGMSVSTSVMAEAPGRRAGGWMDSRPPRRGEMRTMVGEAVRGSAPWIHASPKGAGGPDGNGEDVAEGEQVGVAADERIGLAGDRQLEERLVGRVAAFRRSWRRNGDADGFAVREPVVDQLAPRRCVQTEFRVGQRPDQLEGGSPGSRAGATALPSTLAGTRRGNRETRAPTRPRSCRGRRGSASFASSRPTPPHPRRRSPRFRVRRAFRVRRRRGRSGLESGRSGRSRRSRRNSVSPEPWRRSPSAG